MRSHIDKRLIPAVVYVAAAITAPGCVRHSGRGDLIIGEAQQPAGQSDVGAELVEIAGRFGEAGIPVRISDNVEGELWAKLVMNCATLTRPFSRRQPKNFKSEWPFFFATALPFFLSFLAMSITTAWF
jgi:ketopantoate reductase